MANPSLGLSGYTDLLAMIVRELSITNQRLSESLGCANGQITIFRLL